MLKYSVTSINKNVIRHLILAVLGTIVISCASIGSPSGGDYDFDPPKVLSSTPQPNQAFVKSGKIQILFDELIQIDKPMDKVIVTPPQQKMPVIQAQNNKVIVELKDTLIANTTYTIDFTDAIVDNNEKNALANFALSFSTGTAVDTLSISGKVLSAHNLEPVSGIYVGIHSDLSDTAFTKLPFKRISRTNELGQFTIKGIAPGEYKLYALDDISRDYRYDNPDEAIAFLETVIVPTVEGAVREDTVFNKDLTIDTIRTVNYTRFLPDNMVLRSFKSDFKRQYLQKHERLTDDVISIYWGAATEMPKVESLGISRDISKWSVLERTAGNDTLKYWITEKAIADMDSISLKVTYNKTDSLNRLQSVTDTLSFINRTKKIETKNDKKKAKESEVTFLTLTTSVAQIFDVYKNIDIEFNLPVKDFDKNKIRLSQKQDSTFSKVDYLLIQDTLNPRKYQLQHKWRLGAEYRLAIDSAAIHSYTGLWNDKLEASFKIKRLDEYGSFIFNLSNLPDSIPVFVELLDKSDKAMYQAAVKDGAASFEFINPGIYYARAIADNNGNGKWDAGEFYEKRQPEMVYYYSKALELKAFWEIKEYWDLHWTSIDKQKPLDITKNKPKDDEKRKKMMERRDAQNAKKDAQQNSNRRNNTNGMNRNGNIGNGYNSSY